MGAKKDTPEGSELRQRAEKELGAAAGSTEAFSEMSPEKAADLIHELQVHQIELKMQNDELGSTRDAFEKARDRYADLYDFAPIGYFTLNQKGVIDEANLTFASMLGIERDGLIGQPFTRFILRDDQDTFYKNQQRFLETAAPQPCDLRLVKKSGHAFYARLECTVLKNEGNDLKQIRMAVSDVTDRKHAEKKLKQSRDLLLNLACLVPGVIYQYRLNPDGSSAFPWSSPGMNDIYEVTPEEVKEDATPVFGRLHPEDLEMVSNAIQESARTLNTFYCEFRVILPRQGLRWCWSQAQPERTEDGGTLWHGIISDITERKQAELELQVSEVSYRTLAENLPGLVYRVFILENNRMQFFNDQLQSMTGYNEEELKKGRVCSIDPLILPEDMKKITASVEEAIRKGTHFEVEYRITHRDGDIRYFWERGRPILGGDGKPQYIDGIILDITERRLQEKRLISLKRRNQALLDHSPVCHKIVDFDFNLQYMSSSGFKMLKLDHNADFYGKPYPFYFFPEAFRNKMTESLMTVKNTGNTITMEALTNDIEGNEVWLDSSLIPVFNEEEKIDFITVVSADVTQRKLDEITKERLEDQLRQAQKIESVGNLAGGIAHDFNNILFPIVGLSEILLEDLPQGSTERENAKEIYKAGKRGSDLVKQILAFSRQYEHKMMPTRIQNVLKEATKLSRSTIPAYIEIKQDIQQDCGMVLADPSQIHQIVMNIITNAYHALEDAGGTISVTFRQKALDDKESIDINLAPGVYAVLSISDTGHGMSKELIGKIFDPYFTTKEQGKGTGLGLAVVYGIVQEHGGNIEVYSEIGKGSTFDIYLPLMKNLNGTEPISEAEEYQGGNERILLVDDEESIANLEKQMFERMGYKVTSRLHSVEALEVFSASPSSFDLVVTDMSMPNIPGDELARKIKFIRSDVPIIICTGFSERIREDNIKEFGIDGLLMKPVVKSKLAKTVRKVLDEAKAKSFN